MNEYLKLFAAIALICAIVWALMRLMDAINKIFEIHHKDKYPDTG